MKVMMMMAMLALSTPLVRAEEETPSAVGTTLDYAANRTGDALSSAYNSTRDFFHPIGNSLSDGAKSAADFLNYDVFSPINRNIATYTGDAVEIHARLYKETLNDAQKNNFQARFKEKMTKEREYQLNRSKEEVDRLTELKNNLQKNSSEFQIHMKDAVVDFFNASKKLDGLNKEQKEKLNKLLDEHKKNAAKTLQDGESRIGSEILVNMKEVLTDVESAIVKSPTKAKKFGLDKKFDIMKSLLEGSIEATKDTENRIAEKMAAITELNKYDIKGALDSEADVRRLESLGSLTNSVGNLIAQSQYSRARSELAFAHFDEVAKEIDDAGIKSEDVKKSYKNNLMDLTKKFNDTPIGLYVNSQIAKALGNVCDLVTNQCKDANATALFDFMDDSSRVKFKSNESNSPIKDSAALKK